MRLRPAVADDAAFLSRMLYETTYLPGAVGEPIEVAMGHSWNARFVDGWGRPGDVGVVAEEPDPIGAAWYRRFSAEEIYSELSDPTIPELAIAVDQGRRRRGAGRALLESLIDRARADGLAALDLNADSANHSAIALYRSLDFVEVAPYRWGLWMRKSLSVLSADAEPRP